MDRPERDYSAPDNFANIRGLTMRRVCLGRGRPPLVVQSLERFIRKEPLRRVHECVFGVLALESEPVDPRL